MNTNQYCGHCTKKLQTKKDKETGFCSSCRKPPPDEQLAFDQSVYVNKKKRKGKKRWQSPIK